MILPKTYQAILGYPISTQPVEACVQSITSWIDSGSKPRIFVCANPHSIIEGLQDRAFHQAMLRADLITPDGFGMVLASRLCGGALQKRITGSDIFSELSEILNKNGGYSYFFLGSTNQTLSVIARKMTTEYPNIRFSGAYSPPFKPEFSPEDNRRMVEAVNTSKADVLWVGMTAPKQEKWVYQHRHELNVKFIGCIGAVFDFYAGNIKRSHPFFQSIGLEWLPRLFREPHRLWRRMFISAPIFMLYVLRQMHRQRSIVKK